MKTVEERLAELSAPKQDTDPISLAEKLFYIAGGLVILASLLELLALVILFLRL